MIYKIPEIPPSNNRFIGRTNRWEYQKHKKYWGKCMKNGKWTPDEVSYLKQAYKNGRAASEIARELGRTDRAVKNKAYKIGISKPIRIFTEKEKEILKEWYENHPDELNLKELAIQLNRTEAYLCKQAKLLNLTQFGRKPKKTLKQSTERLRKYSSEHPEQIKKALKLAQERNRTNPPYRNPRKFTNEDRQKLSERTMAMWADPNSVFNSVEFKEKQSQRQHERMIERLRQNPTTNYSRGKGGKRADLNNMYFRSAWEANYARYLNLLLKQKLIYKWEYEPDTFYFEKIKRGTRSYTPDFKIWETEQSTPYYVEVKGWMDDKSKTKLKRMAKYYPKIKIELVCEQEYKEIKNKVGKLLNFE